MGIESTVPEIAGAPADDASPAPAEARWYSGGDEKPEQAADSAAAEPNADNQPAGAPEKYELALEGVDLDKAMVAEAAPILRELNLSNDAANKLVPVAAKLVANTQDRTMQALIEGGAKQKKEWLAAYHADPTIGGANRAETERLTTAAMGKLGFGDGHPFRKALTDSGFGNHPDMIRTFRLLGELLANGGQPSERKRAESRWYGSK